MRKRIHQILTVSKNTGDVSFYFDVFLVTLILMNVVSIVLESIEPIRLEYQSFFNTFEMVSVVIFSVEYILRVWSSNEDERFRKLFSGNIKFALTPLAIIDLLAVLPFYLPLLGVDLRFLRIMRLFRLFRLFKISRYIKALALINDVFKEKKEELFISTVLTIFMLLMSSTLMYYVENEAQPLNFSSIPQTMWWGIATLTTVGYGDIYPITGLGKLLGGAIAIIGIGLFALPTGILASGFSSQLAKNKNEGAVCTICAGEIKKIVDAKAVLRHTE